MARYFFNTEDGTTVFDEDGSEFPTIRAAKVEAVRLLADSLSDEAETFWDHKAYRLTVTNDQGLILFALELSTVEAPAIQRTAPPLA